MPIYTEKELLTEKASWKAALAACATGKSYTIDGRSLTRQNLPEIRAHLEWLEKQLLNIHGRGTMLVRPIVRR